MKTVDLFKAAALLLLMGGIYASAAQYLVGAWNSNPDYSYGYLIPIVVLYLLWDQRERLAAIPSRPSWSGAAFFIPGLILFWVGELGGEYTLLYLSSWLVIVGAALSAFGLGCVRAAGFSLFLLLTMFPLPSFIHSKVSLKLKLLASKLGVDLMQAMGMSAFREGNVIDLGFTSLQVVDACNGIRYLFPLLVLALVMVYFYRAAMWKRVLVVLSAVPISILVNGLRIASVGILYQHWGPVVAEGFFHDFSGWFIFMVSLGLLLAEMWVLKHIGKDSPKPGAVAKPEEENRGKGKPPPGEPERCRSSHPEDDAIEERNPARGVGALLHPPGLAVLIVLLGVTLAASQGIDFRERIPARRPFAQFPTQFEGWQGQRHTMEEQFVERLDFSDYVLTDYRNPLGRSVNFYLAYYESQRKGESIHSPETCLPGGGWKFQKSAVQRIDLPAGGNLPVNRTLMVKGDQRQLTYFWFPARGRMLTNLFELKIYTFWDALTRQRTDGALVRLITPIYDGEDVSQAEARLQDFTRAVVPVLDQFLPN